MNQEINSNIGWNFDNSYTSLPNDLMSKIEPEKVAEPKLAILNQELANELNLNFYDISKENLALIFSGNKLPTGSESIAQAYAGHQFGHFTILGDGRALLIGEHISKLKKRYDIQLKGSGKTPYSRNGDGRATLGSMLREYLMSESMNGLKIPTTRSLAVVTTGEKVIRENIFQGGILTRVASSHIRVGTFQYLATNGNIEALNKLLIYTINRHYPDIKDNENLAISLLEKFIDRQISLIINWLRVGFIHGVQNSDNVTLSGETIDYGPCSFMDYYNPKTVFSSIDHHGRYSFMNQELICHWNVSRFAETLIPFFSDNQKKSIEIGTNIINQFNKKFKTEWLKMMKNKLGFIGNFNEDEIFISKLLLWMENNKADYTNTFLYFLDKKENFNEIYNTIEFIDLFKEWENRISRNKKQNNEHIKIMKKNNPEFIPRNHLVEKALDEACELNDYTKFNQILKLTKNAYSKNENTEYKKPASIDFTKKYQTFCGT